MLDSIAQGTRSFAQADGISGRRLRAELWRRPGALVGLLGLIAILTVAIGAPWFAPHDPLKQDLSNALLPPLWQARGVDLYPLGTDALGRDLASRLLYGARYSLVISSAAALVGSALGLLVGLVAGFRGGWLDAFFMRLGDVQLAFPFILLAIVFLGATSERSPLRLILVLGIPSWIVYARVVRGRVLAERAKDYALAATALGASPTRRLFRYILPNVWQVIPLIVMLDLGFLVIIESMLSFLGFGLTPPTPSWGSILAEGKQYMIVSPWMPILPGLAIMATVLSINLTADSLADIFDPKLARVAAPRSRPAARITPPGTALGEQPASKQPLLTVRKLTTEFITPQQHIYAVRGVSFDLERGQVIGIVGESGSGKSVLALSILRLLEWPGQITGGDVRFAGQPLVNLSNGEMTALRGKRIGMIFQNPSASLNPVLTIGAQMSEALRHHGGYGAEQTRQIAGKALAEVGIADPGRVLRLYPFQLSGGMNQRVMIALALALQPELILADEPTTALDVTTQAQILAQLRALIRARQTSLILITHDMALLAGFVDRIVVMYAGQVCENGPTQAVISKPRHPYTQALLAAAPRAEVDPATRLTTIPGEPPDAAQPIRGCPFAPRCPRVMERCWEINPAAVPVGQGHLAACHLYGENG
jgi:oligopeptide/dipeptide ABC transporter ATP-binding protein